MLPIRYKQSETERTEWDKIDLESLPIHLSESEGLRRSRPVLTISKQPGRYGYHLRFVPTCLWPGLLAGLDEAFLGLMTAWRFLQAELTMNSMKLVIPLHSLYWSIHTKDESKRGIAFAFIFGVN